MNPEMAELVKAEEPLPDFEPSPDPEPSPGPGPDPDPGPTPPVGPRRITATKTLRDDISLDEVNDLREEIIRNLRDGGGRVSVTITIEAEHPDGFSDSAVRTVKENSGQLGLDYAEPYD